MRYDSSVTYYHIAHWHNVAQGSDQESSLQNLFSDEFVQASGYKLVMCLWFD